ncbi:hypothetical protein HN814_11205, partial [Candidatus Woesearchaeota archaeon]|nr:hypothetical protein [Candidatus Woesearchaeota archaeon]
FLKSLKKGESFTGGYTSTTQQYNPIGSDSESGWKNYLKKGAIALGIVGVLSMGGFGIYKGVSWLTEKKDAVETIEEIIVANPDQLQNLDEKQVLTVVRSGLELKPEYSDMFIQESIKAAEISGHNYNSDTYLVMFDVIKREAELKPEIMDHFGPKAKDRLNHGKAKKFVRTLEDEADSAAKVAKKKMEDTWGFFKDGYVLLQERFE